jgi:hypothetical protein
MAWQTRQKLPGIRQLLHGNIETGLEITVACA